jgi:hypothetical protein
MKKYLTKNEPCASIYKNIWNYYSDIHESFDKFTNFWWYWKEICEKYIEVKKISFNLPIS